MIDHLIYATPDLQAGVAELDRRCGVRLTPGGRHLTLGTRNFLADLGDRTYLEVLGPDPEQPEPAGERPLGIDHLTGPRLAAWVARVDDLDEAVRSAAAHGHAYDPVFALSRDREDGVLLRWRMAAPSAGRDLDGVIPLLIQWDGDAYAAESATKGLRLVSLTVSHPDAEAVRQRLAVLGLADDAVVRQSAEPSLAAVLETPAGRVELR